MLPTLPFYVKTLTKGFQNKNETRCIGTALHFDISKYANQLDICSSRWYFTADERLRIKRLLIPNSILQTSYF